MLRLLSKFSVLLTAFALVCSISVAQTQQASAASDSALSVLATLQVKGRAPKTGYARAKFSEGWASVKGCDTRNVILKRDLQNKVVKKGGCIVLSGLLQDPYTGKTINFVRGVKTSSKVQIDHVVSLSDAWQKGAQQLSKGQRFSIYHDPLNLLAVDGPTNDQKGDGDAATWLPPNRVFRCQYVARQIAVKAKYRLWVTSAEKTVMTNVLSACPAEKIPLG